ncbi:Uncharacterised protein [uncultured Blautia sp.]|nr:Uncharacterised protein [uncultured Blautia sp.]
MARCLIVPADTLIQNGIGDGLDHIPVIVRAAQTLCSQHGGVHHNKIRQMVEECVTILPLLFFRIVERELQLLVPGNMRVAQQSTGFSMRICRTRRVESTDSKTETFCYFVVCLVSFLLRHRFQQKTNEIQ